MTKITVPIPGTIIKGKQYAIEFDSDHIVGVGLEHGMRIVPSDKPYVVREPDGTTKLSFKIEFEFEDRDRAPKWVEVHDGPEPCHYCNVLVMRGPDGSIHATHPRHPSPWECFGNSGGSHVIPKREVHDAGDPA